MRLLITGGLGFIGSHLVDSLSKKNHDIMILTKTLSKKSNISTLNKKITIELEARFYGMSSEAAQLKYYGGKGNYKASEGKVKLFYQL